MHTLIKLHFSHSIAVIFHKQCYGTGTYVTHFLYRFFDGKKTTHSQFSVPGLREIHRNLKQEKFFNSRESFFRKSPFCTFSWINPGFGGPWDKLWIFFLIPIFIMLQKLPKWHFWTCAWNSKNFLAKSILLKHYENGDKKFFHNMSQGLPNPGFMQEKVQKGDFLKKPTRKLKFFCCFRFLWISRRPGTLN